MFNVKTSRNYGIAHKGKKCKSLLTNKRAKDPLPELFIGDEAIEKASAIEYLGDILTEVSEETE